MNATLRTVALAGLVMLGGCAPEAEKPPPEPIPTTGANQAVLYIPAMVCESCPGEVTEALATLPWVDRDSIHADRKTRQVRFAVTDPAAFDLEAVRERVGKKGFRNVRLLVSPTPPQPQS